MFGRDQELAPDLEWLLGSGQPDRELLTEALVEEQYAELVYFSQVLLDNLDQAHQLARATLVEALLKVHTYHSELDARTWLFNLALQTYHSKYALQRGQRWLQSKLGRRRKVKRGQGADTDQTRIVAVVQNLDERLRIPLVLYSLFGFSEQRLGQLTGLGKNPAYMALKAARQVVLLETQQRGLNPASLQDALDATLQAGLKAVYPALELDPQTIQAAKDAIQQSANELSSRGRGVVFLKEFAFIGIAALVFGSLLWGSGQLFPGPSPTNLPVIRWVTLTPTPNLTPTPTRPFYPPVPDGALVTLQAGETLQDIAARLGVDPETLRRLNRIPSGEQPYPGQILLIPDRVSPGILAPIPPTTPKASPEPLTENSSQEEILGRWMSSENWNSLWFDLQVAYYNQPGFYAAAQSYRLQLWFSVDRFLILGGPLLGTPAEALMFLPEETMLYADIANGDPWFRVMDHEPTSAAMDLMGFFTAPPGQLAGYTPTFGKLQTALWAGRQAIWTNVFDEKGYLREGLWIDAYTGWPLRRIFYDPVEPYEVQAGDTLWGIAGKFQVDYSRLVALNAVSNPDSLSIGQRLIIPGPFLAEMRFTSMVYDAALSPELFDPWMPWRGSYAADFAARPMTQANTLPAWIEQKPISPPSRTVPPVGFLPYHNDLSIAFKEDVNLFTNPGTLTADLYAQAGENNYWLGEVLFPNPMFVQCQRSPDGRWLVYRPSNPVFAQEEATRLTLMDLGNPASYKNAALVLNSSEFAFSPDGRYLAILAVHREGSEVTGLRLFDLESGEMSTVRMGVYGTSLVWSPDGQQVAFLGGTVPNGRFQLLVMDIATGQTLASQPVKYINGLPVFDTSAPDWPLKDWNVSLPTHPVAVSECLKAP